MALIIEDGTGKDNADAFVAIDELDKYLDDRQITLSEAPTQETKEAAIRDATEYADTYSRYKGTTVSPDQALMFPRTGLQDWSGHVIEGVPKRLKQAVLYLATLRLQGEVLYEALGREVASESVGPISTSYVAGSNRHRTFTTADRLLAQYVRDPNRPLAGPGWVPPARGDTFDKGMNDMSPAPDDRGYGFNELTGDL